MPVQTEGTEVAGIHGAIIVEVARRPGLAGLMPVQPKPPRSLAFTVPLWSASPANIGSMVIFDEPLSI